MPRNATTGVYTRVSNSFSQPVDGTVIEPVDADAFFDDLTDGLNSLPAELSDRSVTNPAYGAVGDGTADDTVAIQAAFDALTPGVVMVPGGTYSCAHIDVPTGLTLIGDGVGKAIIKCRSAPAAGTDWWYAPALTDVEISGITFDGNGMLTDPAGGHFGTLLPCIYFVGGSNINVHDCEFIGWATVGLFMNTAYDVQVRNNIVTRTAAARTESYAIFLGGTGTVDSDNLRNFVIDGNRCTNGNISVSGHDGSITNNVVTGWGFSAGINTQALASNFNLYIGGNKCYASNQNTDQPGGYYPAGIENWATNSVAEGNECCDNYGSGIDWGGKNGVIIGNNCYNNGTGGAGAGGISLYANDATFLASGTIVIGNRCTDTRAGGARTQAYGYYEQASLTTYNATGIVVGHNNFEGNLTGTMSLISSGTMLTRNSSMASVVAIPSSYGFTGGYHQSLVQLTLANNGFQHTLSSDGTAGANVTTKVNANAGGSLSAVVAASGTAVSHTGDTLEFTLATITIPANAMGANGTLRVTAFMSGTGTAGNRTAKIKFGGTTYYDSGAIAGGSFLSARVMMTVSNSNATNAQVGSPSGGLAISSTAKVTSAVDTTAAVTVLITGQLSNSGDSIALESYTVEVLRP